MSILGARIADIDALQARELGERTRNPVRVGAALLDEHEDMLPCPIGLEPQALLDDKVFRLAANDAARRHGAMRARRRAHSRRSSRAGALSTTWKKDSSRPTMPSSVRARSSTASKPCR